MASKVAFRLHVFSKSGVSRPMSGLERSPPAQIRLFAPYFARCSADLSHLCRCGCDPYWVYCSKVGRNPYSHLPPEPEDRPATLSDLKTFDFYVWNSRKCYRFPVPRAPPLQKSLCCGRPGCGCVGPWGLRHVGQQQNEVMVDAVLNEGPVEPDFTLTEGGRSIFRVCSRESLR